MSGHSKWATIKHKKAATDAKPKLRYTAGTLARRVSILRRLVPTRAFDRQIRKLNQLTD